MQKGWSVWRACGKKAGQFGEDGAKSLVSLEGMGQKGWSVWRGWGKKAGQFDEDGAGSLFSLARMGQESWSIWRGCGRRSGQFREGETKSGQFGEDGAKGFLWSVWERMGLDVSWFGVVGMGDWALQEGVDGLHLGAGAVAQVE